MPDKRFFSCGSVRGEKIRAGVEAVANGGTPRDLFGRDKFS